MIFDYNDLTIIYTVGGHDCHYDNMHRCMESITKTGIDPHFLVLEFGDKLKSEGKVQVINLPDAIDFSSGKKVGYQIWRYKYVGCLNVKTKYGIYVDTDTAMANNVLPEVFSQIEGGVGVVQHFWIPTIGLYNQRAPGEGKLESFLEVEKLVGVNETFPFFAGGVFAFENNTETQAIFQDVIYMYDEFYGSGREYVGNITDEIFLTGALNKKRHLVRLFSGALNHCSMGDDNMPMTLMNDMLFGRNPFEESWCPVLFLHCDVSRRDPSQHYSGRMKELVRQAFGI